MTLASLPTAKMVDIPEIPIQDSIILSPCDTALIVIDMQKDFVDPEGALHVEAAPQTVERIANLIALARKHDVPVIYTQDTHTEDDLEFDIWPRHCVQDTAGWEIVDALRPEEDLVIRKNRYDAFYSTPLEHYLTHVWDIKNLIIVGTVANICVVQTAASAGLRWIQVITPADGISALTEFDQASALRQISMLYNGTVLEKTTDITFE